MRECVGIYLAFPGSSCGNEGGLQHSRSVRKIMANQLMKKSHDSMLNRWYEAHETEEGAISPLIATLICVFVDAGYSKQDAHEQFDAAIDACWDPVSIGSFEKHWGIS